MAARRASRSGELDFADMKRLACLLLLAGCPPKNTPPPAPPAPVLGGVACPSAQDVYVASYVQPAEGEQGGHTGWVLPLFDKQVPAAPGPEYQQLDPATASGAGVPAAPQNLWLLVPGQAACKVTLGSYYAAAIEGQPANVAYGVEMTGCAPPQTQDGEAIVLVSAEPPNECHVVPPRPSAQRLGETNAQKQWVPPTKATPIPEALAAALPPHECTAPGCEMLWSIVQVDVAGAPVAWGGTVNWLHPDASPPCNWAADAVSGFYAAGADGRPQRITEGQDHPLILTGVLADKTGAKVLLAEGAGEYASYDLAAGAAPKLGRHLVWLVGPAEAYAVDDHIGPECPHNAP